MVDATAIFIHGSIIIEGLILCPLTILLWMLSSHWPLASLCFSFQRSWKKKTFTYQPSFSQMSRKKKCSLRRNNLTRTILFMFYLHVMLSNFHTQAREREEKIWEAILWWQSVQIQMKEQPADEESRKSETQMAGSKLSCMLCQKKRKKDPRYTICFD